MCGHAHEHTITLGRPPRASGLRVFAGERPGRSAGASAEGVFQGVEEPGEGGSGARIRSRVRRRSET
jgi:hypothetical protein